MKILIAGDFVPQCRVASLIEQEKYDEVLGSVKTLVGSADFSIVNL